ncbi:MAG TPA: alpha-amylase family glycosyl hydrolase [Pyrinomonadaceae bacterium]|jgi:glycosidase
MHRADTKRAARLCAASFFTLCLVCFSARAQTDAPAVLKVEPPNWWANHSINPVRLLVRGRNLHGARVTPTRPETEPSAVVVNPAGTYLFASVRVAPNAPPGDYPLQVETARGRTTIPFRLEPPLDPATNFQGVTTDDVLYLIMTDRFADGDPANDAPKDAPPAANDRKNPRAWHGGDFRGVINRLPYLKDLGVTALWLTPWYDNWNGVNACDKPWCPNTYYHGYHADDYYAVEDRFGDMQTLRELVARAHASGLKVIQDQVANHVGSRHPWMDDPPLDNWFHGTRASHLLNQFRGDLLSSPHAPAEARRPTLDGWFSDDLPDVNQDEPEVARYEIQNALWWIGMTGIDGVRQDTIQYMPRPFIRALMQALHRQYPRLWMVGEVFDFDPAHTSFFLGGRAGWDGVDTTLDSVFDFPLAQTSLRAFAGQAPVSSLHLALRADAVYTEAARLTTMTSNHDVPRLASLPGMTPEGLMLHVAFLTSTRGTPQLYYGDEIAMPGGGDPDNRRDFPGGWPGDTRSAFDAAGRTPDERRVFDFTRAWLALRREHTALRRGALVELAFDDDAYAYARRDASETVIVALNRAAAPKTLTVPAAFLTLPDGARLTPLTGAGTQTTVAAGQISVVAPARAAVAYKVDVR